MISCVPQTAAHTGQLTECKRHLATSANICACLPHGMHWSGALNLPTWEARAMMKPIEQVGQTRLREFK
jgi:hypothetical protein